MSRKKTQESGDDCGAEPPATPLDGDAEAIAEWLEAGAMRPNKPEYTRLDPDTYLAIAKLIREGWYKRRPSSSDTSRARTRDVI